MGETVRLKVTPASIDEAIREVDWATLDARTDEDLERAAAEDPDAPVLTEAQSFAGRLKLIRKRRNLTQDAFASRYAVPLGMVQAWESGEHDPDPIALAYLRVIEREPEAFARALMLPRATAA